MFFFNLEFLYLHRDAVCFFRSSYLDVTFNEFWFAEGSSLVLCDYCSQVRDNRMQTYRFQGCTIL